VWSEFPGTHIILLGQGTEELARSNHRLHGLGEVAETVKAAAFGAASLLCVPSAEESFGIVYVEAACAGVPAVGSPIAQVAEVIRDGETGLLPARDPAAIAAAILTLLRDPVRRQAMGQAARRRYEIDFAPEVIRRRVLELYRDLRPPPHALQPRGVTEAE